MSRYKKEVEKALINILINYNPSTEKENINKDSDFLNDLGIDSLGIHEISFEVEDEFDVMITDKDIETFKTIKDIVDYIDKQNTFKNGE